MTITLAPTTPAPSGWYTSAVTATVKATDAAGIKSLEYSLDGGKTWTVYSTGVTLADGAATKIMARAEDNTGLKGSAEKTVMQDTVKPTVALKGGPAADSTVDFGSVPAAPTCEASDATSGLAKCEVTGYSTEVGTHTVTATATDNAGHTNTATRSYTVKAWTLSGFYQPVDMNGVLNTVKAGATVPLKFEVFKGATELTDTSIVSALAKQITCGTGSTDDVELTTTGSTSLRYDTTAGQFVYNWQTPKTAGNCYNVTLTTQDGSKLTALFRTK